VNRGHNTDSFVKVLDTGGKATPAFVRGVQNLNKRIGIVSLVLIACACKTTPEPVPEAAPTEAAAPAEPATPEIPKEQEAAPEPVEEAGPVPEPAIEPIVEEKVSDEAANAARAQFESGVQLAPTNPDAAMGSFKLALASDRKLHWAHYNIGVLHERKGEAEAAVLAYYKALEAKPDFTEASENLTRVLLRLARADEAELALRRRILKYPANIGLRNQLVRVLIQRGRLEPAEAESKKVLKADERNVAAMINLAAIWYRQKRYEMARDVLENAKENEPWNATVWNALAFVQTALDQKPTALESFKKAAELREDYPEAHNNYGALLNESKDYEGAIPHLELATKYAPDYADAWLNLGNAYRGRGELEKALAAYNKVLALDPKRTEPLFNLGVYHFDAAPPGKEEFPARLKRLETAKEFLERFRDAGGKEPRLDRYLTDLGKAIEKTRKDIEREERDRVKKIEDERKKKEEAERKAREEKEAAEKKAREEAEKKARLEGGKLGGIKEDFGDSPAPAPGKIGGEDEK
jgi:tetratricopeptide (TPR) repeat protein